MRTLLAASILVLAGCSTHQQPATHAPAESHTAHVGAVTLTGAGSNEVAAKLDGAGCHHGATDASMASAEAKGCSMKKADMAATTESAAGCHGKKVEMAAMSEGVGAGCHGKKAEMASAEAKSCHASKTEMASADSHAHGDSHKACGSCPQKADGSCDHEAGAKAGRQCCMDKLAAAKPSAP